MKYFVFLVCCMLVATLCIAEQRYVTDDFEITLRRGPSGQHAILLMVKSGTVLEVVEKDAESGYSKVKTGGGTEGWVLSRYLMREPAAKVQLHKLVSEMVDPETVQNKSMRGQVEVIKKTHEKMTSRISQLEQEKQQLAQQMTEIKNTAANALAIDAENQQLHQKLVETKSQLETLNEQYAALSNNREKDWFITGALVLFGGLLLGLIIPKITRRKRSRYSDF